MPILVLDWDGCDVYFFVPHSVPGCLGHYRSVSRIPYRQVFYRCRISKWTQLLDRFQEINGLKASDMIGERAAKRLEHRLICEHLLGAAATCLAMRILPLPITTYHAAEIVSSLPVFDQMEILHQLVVIMGSQGLII